MTYRPAETLYGPPWPTRIPALLYLIGAGALLLVVWLDGRGTSVSPHLSALFRKQEQRIIDAQTLAAVVTLSALAAVVRSSMRGIRISGDGLEYRDVVSHVFPKVKKYRWAQIDAILLDRPGRIVLDLWDGSRVDLPPVADLAGLAGVLERVAAARAIPVRGGKGLDEIPETGEFTEE